MTTGKLIEMLRKDIAPKRSGAYCSEESLVLLALVVLAFVILAFVPGCGGEMVGVDAQATGDGTVAATGGAGATLAQPSAELATEAFATALCAWEETCGHGDVVLGLKANENEAQCFAGAVGAIARAPSLDIACLGEMTSALEGLDCGVVLPACRVSP